MSTLTTPVQLSIRPRSGTLKPSESREMSCPSKAEIATKTECIEERLTNLEEAFAKTLESLKARDQVIESQKRDLQRVYKRMTLLEASLKECDQTIRELMVREASLAALTAQILEEVKKY